MSAQEQQMERTLNKAIRNGVAIPGLYVVRSGKNWQLLDRNDQVAVVFSYSAGFYAWLARAERAEHPVVPTRDECFQRTICKPKAVSK